MSVRTNPYQRATALPYESVGGWMLLLCIALCVIRPVMGGFTIYVEAAKFSWAQSNFFGRSIFVWALAIEIALILFGVVAGAALWSLRKRAVGLTKTFLIAQFVVPLLYFLVLLGLVQLARGNAAGISAIMLPALARSLFFGVLWWIYLHRSVRVKRTLELQREREADRMMPAETPAG